MPKDWNDTTPEERTVLLSPMECMIIEAYRDMEKSIPNHFRVGIISWDPDDVSPEVLHGLVDKMVSRG